MTPSEHNLDVTRNLRLVEWLKCEMLSGMASFYRLMLKGSRVSQEALADVLANIILVAYLLARRMGMTYAMIDLKIHSKIKLGVTEEHEVEKWYRDLSELAAYMNRNRK